LTGQGFFRLQALVFTLVAAAISNLYLTQPVLPVIQQEFGVSAPLASVTVSVVILGIALANLPFGWLADRYPIKWLIGWARCWWAARAWCAPRPPIF
jgi:MFS transporter, YNFM family, putative membrane transport protein